MLEVTSLTKSYTTPQGPLPVLRGVNLSLEAGKSLALMGESGSGKSTLLHLIGGLDAPDAGQIRLHGLAIDRLNEAGRARYRREQLGLIFQQFNLVPSLKVYDNLTFQARLAGRVDAHWLDEVIQRLGLSELLERYPEQLSGGQQQRVAIGRAVAGRPPLLLADEPTGSLDEATGDQVMALLLELVAASRCSLLMVTHSARLAGLLDRQVRLRAGRIEPVRGG